MVFEIVPKNVWRCGLIKPMQITVRKSGFNFGTDIREFFGDKGYVEVYLDISKKKVGFVGTDNPITGFRIQTAKSKQGTVACSATTKRLQEGVFDAEIEDGFVVIKVPEIAGQEFSQ